MLFPWCAPRRGRTEVWVVSSGLAKWWEICPLVLGLYNTEWMEITLTGVEWGGVVQESQVAQDWMVCYSPATGLLDRIGVSKT